MNRTPAKLAFIVAGMLALAALGNPSPPPQEVASVEQIVKARHLAYPPASYEGRARELAHRNTRRGDHRTIAANIDAARAARRSATR